MNLPVIVRAATLAGVAVAALAPNVRAEDPPNIEEGIKLCVEMREKIFECKEVFADFFAARHNAPEEEKKAVRAKALQEIIADGSGPLEPRRKACAAMAKHKKGPSPDRVDAWKKAAAECGAKTDCNERVACFGAFMKPGGGKAAAPQPTPARK